MQRKEQILLSIFIIVVLVIYIFQPAVKNGFINFDDPEFVTNNSSIQHITLANLKAIFTTHTTGMYQPIVNLSYMLEYHFFGPNPTIYHATNIIIHVLNTCLVFWLILLLDGSILISLLTALFFGIHPLRVESVVWISQRKDVLYSFFYLWALIEYCRYIKNDAKKHYYRSFVFFLLSLFSKSMAVTLPVVFFVVDYLLRRKMSKRSFIEKTPFFIFSIIFGFIALFTHGKFSSNEHIKLLAVLKQALVPFYGVIVYLYNMVFPVNLSLANPYPSMNMNFYLICALALIALCMISWIVFLSRKYTRKVVFGFLFALIIILPVLQFITAGSSIVADHYTYLPSIGIFYIFSASFLYLFRKNEQRPFIKVVIMILLISIFAWFLFLTSQRIPVWKDSITIFSDVLGKHPDCFGIYNNRGLAFAERGDFSKAISDFNKAIDLNPYLEQVHNNRGLIFSKQGNLSEAINDFNKALEINPRYSYAYNNRAVIYERQGRWQQAIDDYTKAIELDPKYPEYYFNRGLIYGRENKFAQVLLDLNKAIELDPNLAKAYSFRAGTFYLMKDYDKAWIDVHQIEFLRAKVDPEFLKLLKEKSQRNG